LVKDNQSLLFEGDAKLKDGKVSWRLFVYLVVAASVTTDMLVGGALVFVQ
jgi:hypothetical protein